RRGSHPEGDGSLGEELAGEEVVRGGRRSEEAMRHDPVAGKAMRHDRTWKDRPCVPKGRVAGGLPTESVGREGGRRRDRDACEHDQGDRHADRSSPLHVTSFPLWLDGYPECAPPIPGLPRTTQGDVSPCRPK